MEHPLKLKNQDASSAFPDYFRIIIVVVGSFGVTSNFAQSAQFQQLGIERRDVHSGGKIQRGSILAQRVWLG